VTEKFKDRHPELQHLVRELLQVRQHNLDCAQRGRPELLLHFAEGALLLIALERFVRIVLGSEAKDEDTLFNLLQKATSRHILTLPWDDQAEGIRKLKAFRNAVMHGNYEQAASISGAASSEEFFRSSQYISEVETLFKVVDYLLRQIDITTGKPRSQLRPSTRNR